VVPGRRLVDRGLAGLRAASIAIRGENRVLVALGDAPRGGPFAAERGVIVNLSSGRVSRPGFGKFGYWEPFEGDPALPLALGAAAFEQEGRFREL
jgi:hypothetical protein